jgi:phosphonate dehydrogenase
VGRAIAARLAGFDACVLTHDPGDGDGADSLDALLGAADWVILAAPLIPGNLHLIDAAALARMKPGALLVNPARGSLVDETALAAALEGGRLAGYAADVFECEDAINPDRPSSVTPRLAAPGAPTVLTPHIGSAVESVRRDIEHAAATAILDSLSGRAPAGRVSGPERQC